MKTLRVPLLLFALPALAVACLAPHAGSLVYDRAALAAGEGWRLWTAHWVHFSSSHLAWNLAVLLAAGAWLERDRPGWLWRHTLAAAPLITLALWFVEPGMARYGGLSALAVGTTTLLALAQLGARRAGRPLWAAILLLVVGRIAYDLGPGGALLSDFRDPGVRVSTWAHAAGAVTAGLLWPVWAKRGPAAGPQMTPPGSVTDSRRQGSGVTPNNRLDTQT
jgi:rhomboid family GlyGly-CTERM serine protease